MKTFEEFAKEDSIQLDEKAEFKTNEDAVRWLVTIDNHLETAETMLGDPRLFSQLIKVEDALGTAVVRNGGEAMRKVKELRKVIELVWKDVYKHSKS